MNYVSCEDCFVWQNEIQTLKAILEQSSKRNVEFVVDPKNYNKPLNRPYKKYSFHEKNHI